MLHIKRTTPLRPTQPNQDQISNQTVTFYENLPSYMIETERARTNYQKPTHKRFETTDNQKSSNPYESTKPSRAGADKETLKHSSTLLPFNALGQSITWYQSSTQKGGIQHKRTSTSLGSVRYSLGSAESNPKFKLHNYSQTHSTAIKVQSRLCDDYEQPPTYNQMQRRFNQTSTSQKDRLLAIRHLQEMKKHGKQLPRDYIQINKVKQFESKNYSKTRDPMMSAIGAQSVSLDQMLTQTQIRQYWEHQFHSQLKQEYLCREFDSNSVEEKASARKHLVDPVKMPVVEVGGVHEYVEKNFEEFNMAKKHPSTQPGITRDILITRLLNKCDSMGDPVFENIVSHADNKMKKYEEYCKYENTYFNKVVKNGQADSLNMKRKQEHRRLTLRNQLLEKRLSRITLPMKTQMLKSEVEISEESSGIISPLREQPQTRSHTKSPSKLQYKSMTKSVKSKRISAVAQKQNTSNEQSHFEGTRSRTQTKSVTEFQTDREPGQDEPEIKAKLETKVNDNEKKRREFYNREHVEHFQNFKKQLRMQQHAISEEIKKNYRNLYYLENPDKVQDIDQLMEENIEHILNQEQLYEKIKFAVEKKTQIKAIKEHASQLTKGLKTKAERKYDEAYFRQRMLKNSQVLLGNKTMYLVRKFAQILINKVRERKDRELQTANKHHVKKVLKRLSYNETYQRASPEKPKKTLTVMNNQLAHVHTMVNNTRLLDPLVQVSQEMKQDDDTVQQLGFDYPKGDISGKNLKKKIVSIEPTPSETVGSDEEQDSNEYEPSVPNSIHSPLKKKKTFNTMIKDQKIYGKTFKQLLKMEDEGKSLEEDSDHQMLTKQQTKGITMEVIGRFIENSMQQVSIPLPILQKIDSRGRFILSNYFLDLGNFQALVDVLPQVVPRNVNKIFLVNNSLKDTTVFNLFENLQYVAGIKQVSILQNELGLLTMSKISNVFLPSQACSTLEKFILKDPQPGRTNRKAANHILTSIKQNANNLKRLKKLVLSKINLGTEGLMDLAKAIPNLLKFEYLDISNNGFKANQLDQFLQALGTTHQLKSLNISYNNLKEKKIASSIAVSKKKPTHPSSSSKKPAASTTPGTQIHYQLIRTLSTFVHFSPYLVHLDISGTNMEMEQIVQFARFGMRKSRTVQAVHLDNMGYKYEQFAEVREALNVRVTKDREKQPMVHLNSVSLREACPKLKLDSKQVLMLFQNNLKNKDINNVKELIQYGQLEVPEDQRICFERNLGKLEIIGSHQWREVSSHSCQICQKFTLCLFVWNLRFSHDRFQHHEFYQHHPSEPINLLLSQEYQHPFLVTSDQQVHQMVPVKEFVERQISSYMMGRERPCDTDVESRRMQEVHDRIRKDVYSQKHVEVSYWQFVNQFKGIQLGSPKQKKQWWEHIKDELPKGTFIPFDLEKYATKMQSFYKPDQREQMLKETYACCVYLMPQSKAEVKTAFIKQKWLDGVDFIGQLAIPRMKHLSIYKIEPISKQIKKQKEIRYFSKPKSVFAKWREDTPKVLSTAFATDAQFMKCNKFIRDEADKNQTFEVMQKYYPQLKNQFINQIGTMKSYPVIDWLDFVSHCNNWGIVDKNLTQADIDRIFVAVNYEEEDLEDNDDSSLCRYEFSEIIIRMAKTKYEEKDICETVAESFEKLLVEYIIPNTCEIMPWQEFRDQHLWTLEVDDLFKANLAGVDALYKHFATNGLQAGKRNMSKSDAARILSYCQQVDSNTFPVSIESEKLLAASYSLSKMTLSDEMGEFDKYEKMLHCEFYEFLGRWAFLVYRERKEPLDTKIQYLLEILLPIVKFKFIPVSIEEDIPSESDYDDDYVQNQLIDQLSTYKK